MSILHKNTVLVLNRNWQAINVSTPAMTFAQMATGVVTALDVQAADTMIPTTWDQWRTLPVREGDQTIGTVDGPVRVPTVVVLANFDRVPVKRPKFSARAIRERDGGRCQYTGRPLKPREGNIDHVLPKSRGGATSWDNCVLASTAVNSRKADRTPAEAGLTLQRPPEAPRALPVTHTLRNVHGIPDWEPFLLKVK